jgi:hypothetical protein
VLLLMNSNEKHVGKCAYFPLGELFLRLVPAGWSQLTHLANREQTPVNVDLLLISRLRSGYARRKRSPRPITVITDWMGECVVHGSAAVPYSFTRRFSAAPRTTPHGLLSGPTGLILGIQPLDGAGRIPAFCPGV